MRKCALPQALAFLFLLFGPGGLKADWRITLVDQLSIVAPHWRFEGDLMAYLKDGDIHSLRLSTGQNVRVTNDLDTLVDIPVAIEGNRVWFCSYSPEGLTPNFLSYFDSASGEILTLYQTPLWIDTGPASAEGGRLAIEIGHDIWTWSAGQMEQVTFTDEELDHDPQLSGDYLTWLRGMQAASMHLGTGQTRDLSQAGSRDTQLEVSGAHAVWGRIDAQGRRKIMHHPLGTGTVEVVGVVNEETGFSLDLDEERLLYVTGAQSNYILCLLNLETRQGRTIYESFLVPTTPRLHGDEAFFLSLNCPPGACSELNRVNMETGVLSRVTSYGDPSYVVGYGLGPSALAFVQLVSSAPVRLKIFRAVEIPGLACGATADPAGSGTSIDLVLPIFAVMVMLFWPRVTSILTILLRSARCRPPRRCLWRPKVVPWAKQNSRQNGSGRCISTARGSSWAGPTSNPFRSRGSDARLPEPRAQLTTGSFLKN